LAGLVRFEFDHRSAQEMKERTILLFRLAKELKLLSDIYKMAIIVVNQVSVMLVFMFMLRKIFTSFT
jgi:hypothetical protein